LGRSSSRGASGLSAPAGAEKSEESRKYHVQDEIARGGMGVILRVLDRDLRRETAMKVMLGGLSGNERMRFVEEAQVTGQLEHPNIVPIHDLGVDEEGRPFFTMKLVRGRSLESVLNDLRAGSPEAERAEPSGGAADGRDGGRETRRADQFHPQRIPESLRHARRHRHRHAAIHAAGAGAGRSLEY
jgi:hypothetical protein